MEIDNVVNRRKHFRIGCATPICSEVTIVRINDQAVNTGTTKVCVEDIGPGGLKFISRLDLPVNPNIIIKFYTIILRKPLLLEGIIVRKTEIDKDMFQYGIQFVIDDSETDSISKLLNKLDFITTKGIRDLGSNFCIRNRMECFKLVRFDNEKRAYFRFQCPSPLCAKVIVKSINNKIINSSGDRICIEDIGQGGLKFLSHINYPVIKDILYEFQMIIADKTLDLNGYIVRKKEIETGIFQYGVIFDILDTQKHEINGAIDTMKKEINRRLWFKKSSFCVKDKIDCLRSRNAG
jgi:hypothetical protein